MKKMFVLGAPVDVSIITKATDLYSKIIHNELTQDDYDTVHDELMTYFVPALLTMEESDIDDVFDKVETFVRDGSNKDIILKALSGNNTDPLSVAIRETADSAIPLLMILYNAALKMKALVDTRNIMAGNFSKD